MNPTPVPYSTLTAGTTNNFLVQYETADRAANVAYDAATLAVVERRAKAIRDVCEADYATLCGWFGLVVGDGFGPDYRIQVLLTTSVGSGAANQGYGKRKGYREFATWIHANPYPAVVDAQYDVGVIGIVMAELAEILMSQKGNWPAGASNGEGLSRVAAHLLHPAFVTSFFAGAPFDILAWMTFPPKDSDGWISPGKPPATLPSHTDFRQDWVSHTFTTENGVHGDWDYFSFGCAILFIYYLKSQLGYSMPQIVQAAGDTLEDRYHSLTGKQGGFTPFKQLLDEFYPLGSLLPPVYDLFPLGGGFCRAAVVESVVTDTPPTLVRSGVAHAGTMCGGGEFNYTFYDLHDHLHVTASVWGFAHPVVTWTINGVDVPEHGSNGLIVSALVSSADPLLSSAPKLEQLKLQISVGSQPQHPSMATSIEVFVAGNPGQIQLRFDVTVRDSNAKIGDASATSFTFATLSTQELDWAPEYRQASHDCWNKYITTHNRPLPWLRRYLPDPPLELLAAAHALDELAAEVHHIAQHDRALAEQIDHQFGGQLLKRIRSH